MNRTVFDIVIPSWNESKNAIACLKSIQRHSDNYRVIFVDNGSEEEEFSKINEVLKTMPHLLIRNKTNLGFIKATNAGIRATEAPFVVLMNNDTLAVDQWLIKLYKPLRDNKAIGLSGPLTTTPDSWQGRYPKGRHGFEVRTSGMLAFFCTMFKKEVFETVGLLDEQFGLGFGDDDDYCRRCLCAGFTLALVKDLVIPHHHRSTFKKLFTDEEIVNLQKKAIDKFHDKYAIKAAPEVAVSGDTDLVYVLGSGSGWQNNEIRYSMRSVEKNLSGVRNVYVIGDNPGFFSNKVIHIYYPDELGSKNADGNMARKILRACQEPGLSDDFLFMNDDFIINKPCDASTIPWYHKGDMTTFSAKFWAEQFYRKRLFRTMELLRGLHKTTLQYDYHAPMLMNKHKFPEVMDQVNYAADIGYTFRSLYGNFLKLPAQRMAGQKRTIYTNLSLDQINDIATGATFLGYNDRGLSPSLKQWLSVRFPMASKYESKDPAADKAREVQTWFDNGCPYNEGVNIFGKFMLKNSRLLKYFQSRHDAISEKRLKMTLQAWLR